jgi:hypothetical protein
MARSESEAVALETTARTQALFSHLKDMTYKEQAMVLNSYFMASAVRDNPSIRTVNFCAPPVYYPQTTWPHHSSYGMQHQQMGTFQSTGTLEDTDLGKSSALSAAH